MNDSREQRIRAALAREAQHAVPSVRLWSRIRRQIVGGSSFPRRLLITTTLTAVIVVLGVAGLRYLPTQQPREVVQLPPATAAAIQPTRTAKVVAQHLTPTIAQLTQAPTINPNPLAGRLTVDAAGNVAVEGNALISRIGQYTTGSGYVLTDTAGSLNVIVRDNGRGTDTVYQVQGEEDGLIVLVDGEATLRFSNRQVIVDVTDHQTRTVEFRVADGYPTPIAGPPTAPLAIPATDQLVVGSTVVVTAAGLTVREQPGAAAKKLGDVLQGERLIIVAGPTPVDGVNWWKVSGWNVAGDVGWVNGAFLQRADPAAEEAGRQIAVGSQVEVTYAALNIHREPGVDAETLAVVPLGQRLTVRGGPVVINGRNWWQVSGWDNLAATGWCSERFLRRVR